MPLFRAMQTVHTNYARSRNYAKCASLSVNVLTSGDFELKLIGTRSFAPRLETVHADFDLSTLFVFELEARTGQTDRQTDRRTNRTLNVAAFIMEPRGWPHNDNGMAHAAKRCIV